MSRISDLPLLAGSDIDPAADLLPIVDDSLTGLARSKRVTVNGLRESLDIPDDTIPEAPDDGEIYVRKSEAWAQPVLGELADVNAPSPSDGDLLQWDDTAEEWVNASPAPPALPWWFNPPLASTFTLSNFGGTDVALTDDSDVGLIFDSVNAGSTGQHFRVAHRVLTDPTGDWDLQIGFDLTMQGGTDMGFGISMKTSDGAWHESFLRGNENLLGVRRNSSAAFAAQTYIVSGGATENSPVRWMRLRKVGTTLEPMISPNGKLWIPVTSAPIAVSSYTVNNPTEVGIGVHYSGGYAYRTCASIFSFSLTGSAV
jgi:hypothetical protein